jgi:hypothetical protein
MGEITIRQAVKKGDTIDFAVGIGPDGSANFDANRPQGQNHWTNPITMSGAPPFEGGVVG